MWQVLWFQEFVVAVLLIVSRVLRPVSYACGEYTILVVDVAVRPHPAPWSTLEGNLIGFYEPYYTAVWVRIMPEIIPAAA